MKPRPVSALNATLLFSLAAVPGAYAQQGNSFGDPTTPAPEARQLLDLANRDRAVHGIGPLHWDAALAAAAGQHNQFMFSQPELAHQYPGEPALVDRAAQAGARFAAIAENLAVGPDPSFIEREWLQSPHHRANLLDPRMDAIGISVLRRGTDVYATEDFARLIAYLSPEQIESQVAAILQAQGLTIATDPRYTLDARQTCEMETGTAGGTSPGFVMRWESSSISALPSQLTDRLEARHSRTAAVGACDSAHPQQGFTSYRVAVLLY